MPESGKDRVLAIGAAWQQTVARAKEAATKPPTSPPNQEQDQPKGP